MAQTPTQAPRTAHRTLSTARALLAASGLFFVSLAPASLAQEAPAATVSLDGLATDDISDELIDRLEAWARLHGYIQLFHPSMWAWTTNMFEVARLGYDAAAKASDPGELAAALEALATPVGPSIQVWAADDDAPPRPDMRRGAHADGITAVNAWRHEGYTPTLQMRGPLFSRRMILNATSRDAFNYGFAPDNPYERTLPGGVRVRVPHSLWVDRHGNVLPDPIPRTRVRREHPNTWEYSNAIDRLAAVGFAWNLIQHFHPTIDREAIGWDDALRDGLRDALLARSREDTLRIIQGMLTLTRDAQAEAWDPELPSPALPLIDVGVVEGALTITRVEQAIRENMPVAPGDVILTIDGEPADAVLERWKSRLGASGDEAHDARASVAALSGLPNSTVNLLLRKPDGKSQPVVLTRFRPAYAPLEDGTDAIREVSPGIYYVDGSRADDADVFENARTLLTAAAVIFDLRSPYTSFGMTTLGWATDRDGFASEQFIHIPVHPDRTEVDVRRRDTRILAAPARMLGKMVFLTSPATHGDAEFAVLTMQDFDIGFVVGETTSGAPSLTAVGVLPGGLELAWTALESRSRSGEGAFGRGVTPDVEVIPSRQAIIDGRDEGIEAAVRVLDEFFETLKGEIEDAPRD